MPNEGTRSLDLDKLDNDSGELVQTMFNSLKQPKPDVSRARKQVETLGKYARELRQSLVRLFNTFSSLVDEVVADDLTPFEAKEQLNVATRKFLGDVSDLSEAQGRTDKSFETREVINRQFLAKTAESKNQIQRALIQTGIFVGYAPIVPITQPNLVLESLTKKGIKARMYEGYPLLERQLVAGITMERQGKVVDPTKVIPNQKRVSDKKREAQHQANFDNFVESVKAKFPGMKLMQVGPANSWWSATWVWLIPEKEFDIIRKAAFGGSTFKVMKWGFAFHGSGK